MDYKDRKIVNKMANKMVDIANIQRKSKISKDLD